MKQNKLKFSKIIISVDWTIKGWLIQNFIAYYLTCDLLPVVGMSSNLVFVHRIDNNASIVRENSITCSEAVTFENEKQPPTIIPPQRQEP